MLKSFTLNVDQAGNPVTQSISNAVLADSPLVADNDIEFYNKSTTTFKLKKDIGPVIKNYSTDKAFAVTVDNQPVYFGQFRPAYLSFMMLGLATIDPILSSDRELQIQFFTIDGNPYLLRLDKRNDRRITNALRATGRVR